MNHPPHEITFSAGSEVPDPSKCRVVEPNVKHRFQQIGEAFLEVGEILANWPVLVQAYPASLGLRGAKVTLVDTYLRDVTVRSAIAWAASKKRDVVFVSQPLAGAELLLPALEGTLPKRILWAAGGYDMPASLERVIVTRCRERGCEVSFLYSYGVAEVGHSCFAATQRDCNGLPSYRKIADEVEAVLTNVNSAGIGELGLKGPQNDTVVDTGDFAIAGRNHWTILANPRRLADPVRDLLEAWTESQWRRRTGYLYASRGHVLYQLRRNYRGPVETCEVPFHRYWERFDGSLLSKPNWGIQNAKR